MTDKVIIALDAMGGDYAPVETSTCRKCGNFI